MQRRWPLPLGGEAGFGEHADRPEAKKPSLCGLPRLALRASPRKTQPARTQITQRTGESKFNVPFRPGTPASHRAFALGFGQPFQSEFPLGCACVMEFSIARTIQSAAVDEQLFCGLEIYFSGTGGG